MRAPEPVVRFRGNSTGREFSPAVRMGAVPAVVLDTAVGAVGAGFVEFESLG